MRRAFWLNVVANLVASLLTAVFGLLFLAWWRHRGG